MLSDIEIAQQATLLPVKEVAAQIGITEDELEFYGKYKAKLSDELSARVSANPDGKLILVTAINPTPAGEGKTTMKVKPLPPQVWDRLWLKSERRQSLP